MPNDLSEDDLLLTLSRKEQNLYHQVMNTLEEQEKQLLLENYPKQLFDDAIEQGLPLVEVEELFDYDLFYPYVPLFIPWERMAYMIFVVAEDIHREESDSTYKMRGRQKLRIFEELEHYLVSHWSSYVQYITVIQRAEGILLIESSKSMKLFKNLIIINAGGGGDIPIPLLAGEQPILNNVPDFGEHKYWISFIGSAREGLRSQIIKGAELRYKDTHFITRHFRTSASGHNDVTDITFGDDSNTILKSSLIKRTTISNTSIVYPWMTMMGTSMLQLAPRGTNPTSFRLYEALQMGLIPVYIYDKERPWLPYYRHNNDTKFVRYPSSVDSPWQLWDRIGFIVHIDDYDAFLDILPELASNGTWYRSMRQSIAEVRDLYFTYEGVIRQIYRMLLNPRLSDLTCSLPAQLFF